MQKDNPTRAPKATHQTTQPAPISGKAFLLKTCRTCGEDKPLRAFYIQKGCRERQRLDCMKCWKAELKAIREERRTAKARRWRRCRKCGDTLPVSEFTEDPRSHSGYHRRCKQCEAHAAEQRALRQASLRLPDQFIPRYSALRNQRIDLGLAIAHATSEPGQCRSREELAAYTGLTVEAVRRIEVRALWKMRLRLRKTLEALGLEDFVQQGVPQ